MLRFLELHVFAPRTTNNQGISIETSIEFPHHTNVPEANDLDSIVPIRCARYNYDIKA